jgi:hypothetical protein
MSECHYGECPRGLLLGFRVIGLKVVIVVWMLVCVV